MRKHSETLHEDRRHQILDAAQLCFARSGFHQTTMQDVAAEAGMSPANIYRYFTSKDALIAGMTERDRARILQDFAGIHDAPDMLSALEGLARKHLIDEPCGGAVMALEIWSEAARNPAVGVMIRGIEGAVHEGLCDVLLKLKQQGGVATGVELDTVARLIGTLVDGLFKRRALEPDFDGEWAVQTVLATTRAALAGQITINFTKDAPRDRSVRAAHA
jgi:AcrR family transcriptional regulator